MFAEDDHPTQRSLPRVRLSEISATAAELEGPATIPSSRPPSFARSMALTEPAAMPPWHEPPSSWGGPSSQPPTSRAISLARPTLVSETPAPPSSYVAPASHAGRPRIPPPPPMPDDLAASAALPLVSLDDDHRATAKALAMPVAPESPICALEREVARLRVRLQWVGLVACLALGLAVALLAHFASR